VSHVLVTGGAGFIGSHLVDALLERGHRVRVLDRLDPQVHGDRGRPPWLSGEVDLRAADVRDRDAMRSALDSVDVVYHLAAAVGVGQSMYRIAEYTEANTQATAALLQLLVDEKRELERLVVASSMSIYGEGRYTRAVGDPPMARRIRRTGEQLRGRRWECEDSDGAPLLPQPTDEDKPLDPTSVYALTKSDQEALVLQVGEAYAIPSVALRFFNVYGPRQALSNPYTGVMAIFSSRLMNGRPPLIFEDGNQRRDFVSVHDVVQALLLAWSSDAAIGQAFNVGSGSAVSIAEVARTLATVLGSPLEATVTGRYRVGDVRHCFADITKARRLLDYRPAVSHEEGLEELVAWLGQQERPDDGVDAHARELAEHGLTV